MIDLLTIKDRVMGGIPRESFEDGDTVEGYIHSAVDAVQTHIDMPLDVRQYRQYYQCPDNVPGLGYRITPARSPVVECSNPFGKDWISVEPDENFVDYSAGFEELPEDINQVIYTLAIYEINRAMGNTYNLTTKTVTSGQTVANITKSPEDFYRDELKRLDRYVMRHPYAVVQEI